MRQETGICLGRMGENCGPQTGVLLGGMTSKMPLGGGVEWDKHRHFQRGNLGQNVAPPTRYLTMSLPFPYLCVCHCYLLPTMRKRRGGTPQYLVHAAGVLLQKLATFDRSDRSKTTPIEHNVTIAWPRIRDHQKNPLSVRFRYDPQSVMRLC